MRLERSRSDSRLFGLCGGMARSMGIGTGWIRLALIVGTLMTGGTLFFVYVIACMIVPKESTDGSYGQGYRPLPAYASFGYGSASGYDSQAFEEQVLKRELQELRAKLRQYEQ